MVYHLATLKIRTIVTIKMPAYSLATNVRTQSTNVGVNMTVTAIVGFGMNQLHGMRTMMEMDLETLRNQNLLAIIQRDG